MALRFLDQGFSTQSGRTLDQFYADQYEKSDQAFYRLALLGRFETPGLQSGNLGGDFIQSGATVGAQISGQIGQPSHTLNAEGKSHAAFFTAILPYAQEAHQTYGVPISVIMGQAALESGYGRSSLAAKYNNFFGVKARKDQPYVELSTKEYNSNGSSYLTKARFVVYPTPLQSFLDHGRLVTNGRYKGTLPFKNDPYNFLVQIRKAGYATDPSYVTLVWSVIKGNNLLKYDQPVGP